jgi:hypothetical protein
VRFKLKRIKALSVAQNRELIHSYIQEELTLTGVLPWICQLFLFFLKMNIAQSKCELNLLPMINMYNSIRHPKVSETISVIKWLSDIKSSQYQNKIELARNGSLGYNDVKSSLPCVTYNFLFNDYKKDQNILNNTGLLYFDIDKSDFDKNLLDLKKVFAVYKSFGGKGYAIIVKVVNLSLVNFKATYLNIGMQLGINEWIDPQASKASQFSVLSSDPDIFINTNSTVFEATEVAPPSIVIREREKKRAYTLDRGAIGLKFNDLDKYLIEGDYLVNWEGFDTMSCFIPMKRIKTKRNNFLLAYCNNFVLLNPNVYRDVLFKILSNVNQYACLEPANDAQLNRIINSVLNYKKAGRLTPIKSNKPRKIIFNKNSNLSRLKKLEICRSEIAMKKVDDTRKKFKLILDQWSFDDYSLITQRRVYLNHSISKKTVEKYWPEFNELIKELNYKYENKGKIAFCSKNWEIPISIQEKIKLRLKEVYVSYFAYWKHNASSKGFDIKLIFNDNIFNTNINQNPISLRV